MDENRVLVKNLQSLSQAHGCDLNASKFAKLINDRAGDNVIDRSYVARILKNSDRDPANISVNKLASIADALGIATWQLLNPMGFDEQGRSRAATGAIDSILLKRSIKYAASASEELGIESLDFISDVAESSYVSLVSGDEEKLGFNLAKLAKSYS